MTPTATLAITITPMSETIQVARMTLRARMAVRWL
jgi:hypothetical protein